jgi:hypothetical protein
MEGSDAAMTEEQGQLDAENEGREVYLMDVDRMVNEGLGGGIVSKNNGLIGDSTTDSMGERESIFDDESI